MTFAERLMIPCGLFFLAFAQDLGDRQSAHSDIPTVSGQFMLVRREAYFAVGGHAAVRGRVSEDLALAACLKRDGRPVLLIDGARLISTRMYDGWRSLWFGATKNLADMMGGDRAAIAAALAALLICWGLVTLPICDVVSFVHGDRWGWLALPCALLALAAATGLHVGGAAHFRIPLWYGLVFPLGYSIGAAIAVDSVRRRRTARFDGKAGPTRERDARRRRPSAAGGRRARGAARPQLRPDTGRRDRGHPLPLHGPPGAAAVRGGGDHRLHLRAAGEAIELQRQLSVIVE